MRAQTYDRLEIIVSDDGSSDGTPDAVSALGDPRIKVTVSEKNGGVATARNRGIAASSGAYVAVCDDDDFWLPGKLEAQVERMEQDGADWSFCSVAVIDEDLTPLRSRRWRDGDLQRRLSSGNPVPGGCSTVVCRRELLARTGVFDPNLSMFADWDLWARFAADGPPAFEPSIQALYVQHEGQMSLRMGVAMEELSRLMANLSGHRATHGVLDPQPIDAWITGRAWANGDRRLALGHALRRPSMVGRAASLAVIARRTVRRAGIRPPGRVTEEGRAAVRELEQVLVKAEANGEFESG